MPKSDEPKIKRWIPFLAKTVKKVDKDTYFVGHSIGCQTILRYIQQAKGKVGGVVFVGGWFTLSPAVTNSKEEYAIAKPWLKTPIDCKKVKKTTKRFVAVFSNNDPYVPMKNVAMFKKRLGAKIIVEKKKGHFSGEDGVKKLPAVLKGLLKMML
ncbi:alpha/beta hydrolase [Candidatus Woesearchaeota archaeon]|nr:alpha/beta hydrolase [Candidatus Woesearchaeota archaeon]